MFKTVLPTILIFASGAALAAPGLEVRPAPGFTTTDDMAYVKEITSDNQQLRSAKCTGQKKECSFFDDMDTCLDLGEEFDCSWSLQ